MAYQDVKKVVPPRRTFKSLLPYIGLAVLAVAALGVAGYALMLST